VCGFKDMSYVTCRQPYVFGTRFLQIGWGDEIVNLETCFKSIPQCPPDKHLPQGRDGDDVVDLDDGSAVMSDLD